MADDDKHLNSTFSLQQTGEPKSPENADAGYTADLNYLREKYSTQYREAYLDSYIDKCARTLFKIIEDAKEFGCPLYIGKINDYRPWQPAVPEADELQQAVHYLAEAHREKDREKEKDKDAVGPFMLLDSKEPSVVNRYPQIPVLDMIYGEQHMGIRTSHMARLTHSFKPGG